MSLTEKGTNFINIPQSLSKKFKESFPGFWDWLNYLNTFISTRFATLGDVTFLTVGKGIVMTNKAGTITKRVFLKDDGTDIDVEDL